MKRWSSLFQGDEPAETVFALLIAWPFLLVCGPLLLSARLTNSTRDFAIWACLGWAFLFAATWKMYLTLERKYRGGQLGALGVWLGVTLAYLPTGGAILAICLEQQHWPATFLLVAIGLGLLWGSHRSAQRLRL